MIMLMALGKGDYECPKANVFVCFSICKMNLVVLLLQGLVTQVFHVSP